VTFDVSGSIAVFFVGFSLLWVVRRIFGKYIGYETKSKFHTDSVGKVLELLIIAGIAYALRPLMPILDSLVNLLQRFVNSASAGWQTNVSVGGAVIVLLGVTILGVYKYWKSDNEWWTVLFAVSILALSAPIPDLANVMQAILVGPVAFLWNFLVGVYNTIINIRFG
jgi:hypothetical protein